MNRASILALPALLAALALAGAAQARPKPSFGGDVDLGIPIGGRSLGYGAGLRAGMTFALLDLRLTPEVGGDYMSFGGGVHPLRLFGGARFAIQGRWVRPWLTAHAGYGFGGDIASDVDASFSNGFTVDGGLGFDFRPTWFLSVGAHVENVTLFAGDTIDWVRLGAHVNVSF